MLLNKLFPSSKFHWCNGNSRFESPLGQKLFFPLKSVEGASSMSMLNYQRLQNVVPTQIKRVQAVKNFHFNAQVGTEPWFKYREINPSLQVHDVYCKELGIHIPEYLRVTFSRLRLSAHRLKIETGRWARLPREQRLCMWKCAGGGTRYSVVPSSAGH